MKTRWILLLSMLTLALGSCGGSTQLEVSQPQELNPSTTQEISTEEPASGLPENPIQLASTAEIINMPSTSLPVDKFIQIAKRDLADRLKIDIGQISSLEAVEFTWPDAALGCPSPGMVYAQGRVPGYRVRLSANEVEYEYHMDQTGQFVLCRDFNLDESIPQDPITPGQTQSVNPGVPIK